MEQETRICQSCKTQFTIAPEDFAFYERIKVPAPTWCPGCRFQRRMTFRSGRRLYKRHVEFSDKEAFSPFPPDSPGKVVDEAYWWSDKWDPMEYGQEYDFSRPFFEQLRVLQLAVPVPHRRVINGVNSDYCENAVDIKNCYLCFNAGFTENALYSESINGCKECVDTLKVESCELSYELFNCQRCFRAIFSSHCSDCIDVAFSINLSGCQNCFGCVNLRNKRFHIFNKPYSREEYLRIVGQYDLGSARIVDGLREQTVALAVGLPVRFFHGLHTVNVSGDYLERCKDVRKSFYCSDLECCAYCQLILFAKSADCLDISVAGGELCYELQEAGGYETKFSWICIPGHTLKLAGFLSLQYCMYCFGGSTSHLFGCIGLRDKQNCILNKQYSKEEYEILVPKIIEHMNAMPYVDKKGREYRYGEFFPPEFSPLPYNETWAQDYFPLQKKKAEEQSFWWREENESARQSTRPAATLPDNIKDVEDVILKEVISCANSSAGCTAIFRIIPQELKFYREMRLPLPRLCPNCRHYQRLVQRNPLNLWHRACTCAGGQDDKNIYQNTSTHFHGAKHCPNEFETSYAPERPEIVYCEACYNTEVA